MMKGKNISLDYAAIEFLDSLRKNSLGRPQMSYSEAVKKLWYMTYRKAIE